METVNDYRSKATETKRKAGALFKAAPEVMKAFGGLMTVASKDGALAAKHKELMALAISIVTRCEECIIHHIDEAVRHGAQRQEVVEAIGVAIEMGGGPATVYGANALAAYDGLQAK